MKTVMVQRYGTTNLHNLHTRGRVEFLILKILVGLYMRNKEQWSQNERLRKAAPEVLTINIIRLLIDKRLRAPVATRNIELLEVLSQYLS